MAKRIGRHTLLLTCSPSVIGYAAVGARKEKQGPLADYFDLLSEDSSFGEKTWEQAETLMQKKAVELALQKSSLKKDDIDFLFAGDLLNQCISSAYASREMQIPFFGLYGACSTMSESLSLASLFVEAGLARHCVAATSSHFCSAERQFRFPLEYGGQRTPTSQWTVTGSGACVVAPKRQAPYVRAVTVGTVADLGITDINNMGAAMAPAAAQTLCQYFADTNTHPQDYDMILTGDLGFVGSRLLERLMQQEGYPLAKLHHDCGLMIYDRSRQDVHAGGSGCGCAASVLCSFILPQIACQRLREVLFLATGALMSPTSTQQGESIPGIAHLLHLSAFPSPNHEKEEI